MLNPFDITIQNQADDEEIIKVWRHHWVTLAKPLFRVLLFALIPFAIILFTGFSFVTSPVLFVIFMLILVFVGTYAAYEWVSWYGDVYILTNYRVIDVKQHGFFSRRFSEATLSKIQDINYELTGILQTFFNYGDVVVQTAGAETTITMEAVHDPQQQAVYLLKQQQQFTEEEQSLSADELIKLLAKHRDELDELAKVDKKASRAKPTKKPPKSKQPIPPSK